MYWKVKIDCTHRHHDKVATVKRIFLVEAADREEARRRAIKFAEQTAQFGPLWVEFKFRELATANLPLELKP